MWEILGVLFSGLYLGTKKSTDNMKSRETDARIARRENDGKLWLTKHTNQIVEDELYEYTKDRANFASIQHEMECVFNELPHWADAVVPLDIEQARRYIKDYTKAKNMVIEARNTVVDIMLARRGYVSKHSAVFGYGAHIGNEVLEPRIREYVYWLERENNKHGNNVKAVLDRRSWLGDYIWAGSSADK